MVAGPDIFLSYNREDADRARHFAQAFENDGLTVWWDVALRSGEAYDRVTEDALRSAKAVVVLWSPRSVDSRWVRAEATLADRRKTLMPAMIEACERPIMFELVQTAELSHWRGDAGDKAWRDFAKHVCELVGKGRPSEVSAANPGAPQPTLEQAAIVVLPFANMSGDPEQEYFADGISEDVITDLSQVSALRVISRNSSFAFKNQNVDIVEVSRQLNVSHVLEGSVRRAGNRVRVTAQLIDGSTNDHVWARRWDRDFDDIFELQDELSQEIVKALKVRLVPSEKKAITSRGTNNLEAYDLYLRARGLYNTIIPEANHKAAAIFREAVALDPEFALAWAGLSEALMQENIYAIDGRDELEREIEAAYQRANALAPDLPEVNMARATRSLRQRNWAELVECIAYWDGRTDDGWGFFSMARLGLGHAQLAAESQMELRRADPLSTGISFQLQVVLDGAGRLDEAEKEYHRSLELQGAKIMVNWRAIQRALARGDGDRARRIYTDGWYDQTEYQPYREDLLSAFDVPAKAREILHEAFDNPRCQDGARLTGIAVWASYFDDQELVLAALRRAFIDLRGYLVPEIWLSSFRKARQDPRFKDIVRDLGLADHWRKTGDWGDFARPLGDDDFEIIA